MEKNKKVALISVKVHNYGSLLQTYALQEFIARQGIANEIINYVERNIFRQLYRLCQISFLLVYSKKVFRNKYLRVFKPELYNKLKIRTARFNDFISTKLVSTKPFKGRTALVRGTKNYAAFILGSDQVLHPDNMRMDYFNLLFVPDAIHKIAYAPSFGVTRIPDLQKVKTVKYLKRIECMSVREQSGRNIVFNLTGRDIPVVCDPTLLICKDDWDRLKGEERVVVEKYILCYFLGKNKVHRKFANSVKAYTGMPIVMLPFMDEYVAEDVTFGDRALFDVGPAEFVNLISNAEYILTDSFHATVFSIIYNKIFYTFNRFIESEKSSTNSRISSIFNLLNIQGRKITGTEAVEDVLSRSVDFNTVHTKLDDFRKMSADFLLEAIGKIGCNASVDLQNV